MSAFSAHPLWRCYVVWRGDLSPAVTHCTAVTEALCSRCGKPAQVAVRARGETADAPRPMCLSCVAELEEKHRATGRQIVELWDAVPKRAFIVVAMLALVVLISVGWFISRLIR